MVNYLAINCITGGTVTFPWQIFPGSEFGQLPVYIIVKEGFLFSRVIDPVK
jgi:hypothetical protein